MATYTLQILNNSGFPKSYMFFMQAPTVAATGGSPHVFTNAWVTFPSMLDSSYDQVTYTDTTYAFYGTAPSQLAPGIIIGRGGNKLVDTSQRDSVTFVSGPPTGFGNVSHGAAQTGSFEIVAASDFTSANNYVFGMSAAGKTPIPTPIATFEAEPNETFNVTPVVRFYAADGAFTPGEVIDVSAVSTKAAVMDFTGKPQTTATVTQNRDGSFAVVYS